MRLGCVAFVILFLRRCLGAELTQSPMSITKNVGNRTRMTCDLGSAKMDVIHWYRQPDGQPLVRILYYSNGVTVRDDGIDDRFKSNKRGLKRNTLTVARLQKEDSGTYYCADWDNRRLFFGTGTKLIVTDVKPQPPILRIFPPDREDLKEEDKFFVACLVTNFFPEVIKVDWEGLEGQNRKILTEPVKKMSDGSYSLISRMEISKADWNDKTITCKVDHETGSDKKVSTNSESRKANSENGDDAAATCPSTEEELKKSTDEETSSTSLRVAIVTYTALLTKSVLYCCIISFVVYKMEYRGTKKST